ncbi:TetR family transcriptional regulator [Pseudoduganella sp. FT25W]|jgi:TetR/AcrR family transcriptional regulator of autoinduction and epiphytic fitness|uniref:TetR family transcriptional regulator n=1 Tax=Duganella alba TaxID=2666081 RepID=A0A6L5QAT5_9BURK|nr:TetR/AcrR family transcriptional regulator [Duganella alba]MRX06827.1 TetR family transcriptional regulator [Duganella alba]MRX16276.1 TetR family transcriptional regulator [Duganella alba]
MNAPLKLTDRKRQAIVEAAIAEFRSTGFESTSMDKIAATAGVSKRTVYNHFPSKDELFAQILHELWVSIASSPPAPYDPAAPLRAQLLDLLNKKMETLQDGYFLDLARVAIAEAIHSPERAQEMVARLSVKEEAVTAWLRAAQADGKLTKADPVLASQMLQGNLKTFAFWPQVTLNQPPLDAATQRKVVDATVDMFLAYANATE